MPKTYHHLFDQIDTFAALLVAYQRARRGKRGRSDVATFELHYEDHLHALAAELKAGRYQPGGYRTFVVRDHGKRRAISAAPFRDRVVHHALCTVLEPIWEPRFIHDSYASRPGKGTHQAIHRAQHFARGYRYVLSLDVEQFFPAIDHAILLHTLRHHVRDERVMQLIEQIVANGASISQQQYRMTWFAGDDLLAGLRPRGLPIGNQTSQFWANVYLHPLDMFIKQHLHAGGYVRYCDDMLLFADDAATLHTWTQAIVEYAAEHLRLHLHENRAHPAPTATGTSFLGWRIFPFRRRLKRRNVIALMRRQRQYHRAYQARTLSLAQWQQRLQSWISHAAHGNTHALRTSLLYDRIIAPA